MNRHITSLRSFSVDRLQSALHDVGGAAQPDYLPDIVAQARRTRQRPAWTFLERWLPVDIGVGRQAAPRAAVIFATLLLVALLAAGAVYIGSQRTQADLLPTTERFDSMLNQISMSYPVGWRTRPATEPWTRSVLAFGAPDVDVIFHPTLQDDLYLALVSDPLNGQSPDAWCCSPQVRGSHICSANGGGGHGGGSYRLEGAEVGFASTMGCSGGGSKHTIVAATATRGYVIQLYVEDERLAKAYDWDWFRSVLGTVDLHPEQAVDAP